MTTSRTCESRSLYLKYDLLMSYKIINPLIATLKPQSNRPPCSNTVIGTLAVDGWTVTFGTTRRGVGGAAARPVQSY